MEETGKSRLIVPAMASLYDSGSSIAYTIVRIVTGLWLMPHGYVKLFGGALQGTATFFGKIGLEPALPLAIFIGCVEFFGGLLIATGLLTRVAAVVVAIELAVTVFYVHWPRGIFWTSGGIEYPLMWTILCVVVFFRGGGKYSVDRAIGREF